MNIKDGKMKTADGLELFWRAWLPEGTPRAVVHLVHGYAEHVDRYQNVVDALVPAGIAVIGNDHRGHGRSEGKKGYVRRMQVFVDDERKFYREVIRGEFPDLPCFLLGHSMGSIISLAGIEQNADGYAGLVLSGTGARPGDYALGIMRVVARIGSALIPTVPTKFPLGADFISRDEAVVQAYMDDPLTYSVITPRLGNELTSQIFRNAAGAPGVSLPVLIQCGTQDISFAGQQELFNAMGSADKTFRFYDGLKHEVYNELPDDRARVLGDLRTWLEAHLN